MSIHPLGRSSALNSLLTMNNNAKELLSKHSLEQSSKSHLNIQWIIEMILNTTMNKLSVSTSFTKFLFYHLFLNLHIAPTWIFLFLFSIIYMTTLCMYIFHVNCQRPTSWKWFWTKLTLIIRSL